MNKIMKRIRELVKEHSLTWRDKPETYWFARFIEQVGWLGNSLFGSHYLHTTNEALAHIASICINWLEMRQEREEQPSLKITITGVSPGGKQWISCQTSVDEPG